MSFPGHSIGIMVNDQNEVFASLFREACEKGLSKPLEEALTEPEAKRLSDDIQERTGLVIGWKSIKNFSLYVTQGPGKKQENPSISTLDTLTRYVLNAPATDELKRKTAENQYSYWYHYRSRFSNKFPEGKVSNSNRRKTLTIVSVVLLIAFAAVFIYSIVRSRDNNATFLDNFGSTHADSLTRNGWRLKNPDMYYWQKRDEVAGHLTLYTLLGDNWPDQSTSKGISNLLTRKIDSDCFSTEIHVTDFVPYQNWQQVGILLSEDSLINGKALRLSLGYNNFFGGFKRPPEIIIQVVGSSALSEISKPEEIAHVALFSGDVTKDSLIRNNLLKSALKIEKRGNEFRFLYAIGKMERFAFKEAAHRDFNISPKYVAIFAMQGLADSENPVAASFDSFNIIGLDCNK